MRIRFIIVFQLFLNSLYGQFTLIPDRNFEKKLIELGHDNRLDGKVLTVNISTITELNIYDASIIDITGIQDFNALTALNCYGNKLVKLDLSNNFLLQNLDCQNNKITFLNLNNLTNLKSINCSENAIVNLDTEDNKRLVFLDCANNKIEKLSIGSNVLLQDLDCSNNKILNLDLSLNNRLISLDISNNQIKHINLDSNLALKYLNCSKNNLSVLKLDLNTSIEALYCYNNKLFRLNISNLKSLKYLYLDYNEIKELNLNENRNLIALKCSNNSIETININENILLDRLDCSNSKNLNTIFFSCDDSLILSKINIDNCSNLKRITISKKFNNFIKFEILKAGLKNCVIENTVEENLDSKLVSHGRINWESNFKSLYSLNETHPNLSIKLKNNNNTLIYPIDSSGIFSFKILKTETYKISPNIDHLEYFKINGQNGITENIIKEEQDFIINSNHEFNDLEVVIIPRYFHLNTNDLYKKYRLVLKNNGTKIQNCKIRFEYNNEQFEFISSTINPLEWEKGKLIFESFLNPLNNRFLDILLKLKSNVLNSDYILKATIIGGEPEETPLDNISKLKQTVRNSYDPNDKTCLEGNTVTPELVGKYVHYVVRFENTGTLEARNIVVKDMIDTTKFDVSSLIVTNSSHSCVTKISETNKVEFIFENINLPFDDATNDGYIAFKIKTLPSLKVGDTFSNTADIFFDYNFPITTNEAKTTVEVLSTNDFAFENYFSLYPNPTKNTVSLSSKNNIEVKNINIFNTLGQLVLSIPNAQTVSNFDVSRLNTGTYFVKIVTNKGTSTTKFIKE